MKTSFFIHNFKINLDTNSKFIFRLISDNLELLRTCFKLRANFEINFYLQELKSYDQIPLDRKSDGFWAYPIYQNGYFDVSRKLVMEVGPRTIKTVISPEENLITGYIVAPKLIEEDLLFDLIFFQPMTTVLKFHNLYLFHSSAVSRSDKAALLTGCTGAGKSILSLCLVRAGFRYLADDDVILKSYGSKIECLSFPTKIKIKEYLLKYFPEFKNSIEKSNDRKNKYKINLEKIYPEITVNKSIPRILIFPCYRKNSKIHFKPISKTESLSLLIRENYVLYKHKDYSYISRCHLKILSNLVKQCQTYQLVYCDEELNSVPSLIERYL